MTALPTVPQFGNGASTLTQLQQLAECVAFTMNPPAVKAKQVVAQTLTNGVFTALTFTVDDLDNVNGHDTSSNTSRYTAKYNGWMWVGGGPNFSVDGVAGRGARWVVNGVNVDGSEIMLPSVGALNLGLPARGMPIYMTAFDYLELHVWQNRGSNLDTVVTSPAQSVMAAFWMGTGVSF